jgi:4-carboxymuconolactone decarboxylase
MSDEAKQVFDEITASRGSVRGPIGIVLPYAPEVARRLAHLGNALRFESTLTNAQTELAIITTTRAVDCAYPWASHAPAALAAGVSPEAVDVVARRGPLDELSADDALIVGFARQIVADHKVSQEMFDRVRARFGEKGLIELTGLIGYYMLITCVITTVDLQPSPDSASFAR